ncbi:MAG: insulinase family protein [Thermoanaerobaculia bacterium]|nr:insulinase family protein [Thermoanaerobaculia bacterium]
MKQRSNPPRPAGRPSSIAILTLFLLVIGVPVLGASGQKAEVPVAEFTLANGMKFLVVTRPAQATVMGGWVAHVGSANERPGITGVAHFFEHMMFKGSRVIGTRDAMRDQEIIADQERLQEQIRTEYSRQRERYRKGEIDDPFSPANRTPELEKLEAEFQKLVEEQRGLMVKDEFDKIYTEAGASGMNATTNSDSTIYFITVPANKIELWFWMESERLLQPVFREFYSERDVVQEERRMRVESTPTGRFDEQLNAMFWTAHPYKWDAIGWMSDLKTLSMADAKDFFSTYYAPGNLTAALVGNITVDEAKALAEKYFGRIPPSARPVPDIVTLEERQLAEKRMNAECDCQPQVSVQFHTVPFEHKDQYALDVVQSLLNGQTGRLRKSLVLDRQIASSASAGQQSLRWNGSFYLQAETKGESTPAILEAALSAELARLQNEPVPADELAKVKNQIVAESYRNLESPFYLLLQLLFYDGWGNWKYLNQWSEKTLAVTAEDVQRVAKQYFTTENRTVASYQRKAGTAAEEIPAELAGLPPEMQQQVLSQLRQIRQIEDPAMLEQLLAGVEQQAGQVPPEVKPALDAIVEAAREQLEKLKSRASAGGGR